MAEHTVHIPWYATIGRGDKMAAALAELSEIAMQQGATRQEVFRAKDDTYKFLQVLGWSDKADFDAFWYGEEASEWRAACQSWYQVPVLYGFQEVVSSGSLTRAEA